jgi:hypothetical protein
MPHKVKVISAGDFIRAQPQGEVNRVEAEKMLRDIAEAGTGLEEYQVLIDVRQVTGFLAPEELVALARIAATHRRTLGHRTAILCPFERFENVRFFAMSAENAGLNVHAFTDYEAAMEWLLAQGGVRV